MTIQKMTGGPRSGSVENARLLQKCGENHLRVLLVRALVFPAISTSLCRAGRRWAMAQTRKSASGLAE